MKTKNKKNHKLSFNGESIPQKKLTIDILILSVVMLVVYALPFASYTYKKVKYTISGIEFIVGKTVAGGKAVIPTNIMLSVALACVVLLLFISITGNKLNIKLKAGLMVIFGIIVVISNIYLSMQLTKLLRGVKNVGISYGSVIFIVAGIITVVRGFYLLWKEKVVSTLDFMVMPGMLYFIINNYIPMVGIAIAFKKIDYRVGILKSPWVGFDNFKILFSNSGSIFKSDAFVITRNTLLYNLAFIILGIVLGILVGICLNDIFSKFLQKFFQTSILLPQLISMVIVAYIVFAFLSNETGMVNKLLGEGNEINFYATKKYWPFILIFVNVWKQLGYNGIIFLSSIVGIDRSIYEASRVDGASKWKQIRYITIPLLKPTVITLGLLQVGRIFYSDFGLFYQVPLDSGALYSVTNTIDTYVYRCLMVLNNISTASAASTYQAVVGFIIVFAVNMIVRKLDKENALF